MACLYFLIRLIFFEVFSCSPLPLRLAFLYCSRNHGERREDWRTLLFHFYSWCMVGVNFFMSEERFDFLGRHAGNQLLNAHWPHAFLALTKVMPKQFFLPIIHCSLPLAKPFARTVLNSICEVERRKNSINECEREKEKFQHERILWAS
jgi:hypothetical protein